MHNSERLESDDSEVVSRRSDSPDFLDPKVATDAVPASGIFRYAWQTRLLPVMVALVVGLTVFFFAASLFQLYSVQSMIAGAPKLDLDQSDPHLIRHADGLNSQLLDLHRWKILSQLEGHAVRQRYHQANVLLMAQVWIRYLGFVTGMMLALVGSVFVLGKIRERSTQLDFQRAGWGGSLSSSSPGLILVVLGFTLMMVTLRTHRRIEVRDAPLFVRSTPERNLPPPRDIGDLAAGAETVSDKGTSDFDSALDRLENELDQAAEE